MRRRRDRVGALALCRAGRRRSLDHTDFTEEVCALLCEEVRKGAKPTRAALAAGFHKNTWSNWCRKADKGDQPYKDRVGAVMRAEAICIAEHEQRFARAGADDWKADEAFLRSRAREDYGQKVEVTARSGEVDTLSRDELLAIAYGRDDASPDAG